MLTDRQTGELTGYPSIDKPWLKYYSEEAINAELPNCSIYEYMYENNKDYPDDIALIYFGRKIKYGELFEKIDAAAKAFTSLGVKSGDIVTVALPSIPEALYTVYALNKIGAVANMIHPLAGKQELINYLNEVESKVAVLFDGTVEILGEGLRETKVRQAIIATAGESLPFGIKLLYKLKNKTLKPGPLCYTWKQFISKGKDTPLEPVYKDPETMAIISHTGGTTGEPKGCMLSDYNVNALCYQLVCAFEYERQGRCLSVLPPFVNYSLVDSMLAMLDIGYTVVLLPRYEQDKFCKYIKQYRPNIVLSIPAYWEAVLDIPGNIDTDMSCLEQIYYGGEGMSNECERELGELLKKCGSKTPLCKGFGATELTAAATQSYPDCNPIGSVGIPLVRTNCMIVEPETYEEKKYLQEGEICFQGPTLMRGYFCREDATKDIIKTHDDGLRWLHTGDLGYINEDGVVFVTGRIKRILMTRGEDLQVTKVFPDRIESVINKHPAVSLSCVIGVPDKQRINYPKAVIELKQKYKPSQELKNDILQFCNHKLPEYQIPSEIEFCDALPRTERGKVDYRELERMAQ
ncbi:MAG: acyl--CoA ligase [Clostridiales bacterium]|nr:acyl--CoA ligase [Clostridiales bacterium]